MASGYVKKFLQRGKTQTGNGRGSARAPAAAEPGRVLKLELPTHLTSAVGAWGEKRAARGRNKMLKPGAGMEVAQEGLRGHRGAQWGQRVCRRLPQPTLVPVSRNSSSAAPARPGSQGARRARGSKCKSEDLEGANELPAAEETCREAVTAAAGYQGTCLCCKIVTG